MKFLCSTILSLLFSFLINVQIAFAEQIDNSNQLNKDSLENIDNIKDNQKSLKSKSSEGDIFGDEQTFPFVAGLGKNAAH
tara:strand:- start:290 stop:529 length:240 start_codon:yes stop_codon:yes gene_type:complete